MPTFTETDIREIMAGVADEDVEVDLNGDILDVEFDELGFDSLAKLDIITSIQQDRHIAIPDDAIDGMRTPRDIIAYVSGRLRELSR